MPTGRAYRSTEARRQRPQEALGRAGPGGHARRWVEARQRRSVARGRSVLAFLRTEIPDYDRRVAGGEVARVGAAGHHGGDRRPEQVDNINLKTKGGTSKTYLISRLKRDAADPACPGRTQARHWLKRLEAGDVSTRQASLAMGYVKPVASIPVDTAAHAIGGLLKVFTLAELATEIDRRQGEAQTSG